MKKIYDNSSHDVLCAFSENTKKHEIKMLVDSGMYRHIRFIEKGNNQYRFDLISWPGSICINGDMGTYVFSRVGDMFKFFANDDLSYSYVAEKCKSQDSKIPVWVYDPCMVEEEAWRQVEEHIKTYPDSAKYLREDIRALLESHLHDEGVVSNEIYNYDNYGFRFNTDDWKTKILSYQFLWCVTAIQWGVKKYSEVKK